MKWLRDLFEPTPRDYMRAAGKPSGGNIDHGDYIGIYVAAAVLVLGFAILS